MKQISDYIFPSSWRLGAAGIMPGEEYDVLADVGQLKPGMRVKFVGFSDVDNHFGIFVFTDATGQVLEVSGDFSGREDQRTRDLKAALSIK